MFLVGQKILRPAEYYSSSMKKCHKEYGNKMIYFKISNFISTG